MILNAGTIVVARRPPWGTLCMGTKISKTEELRTQLDQLHTEAEKTRFKANSARLRLIRLSEAAEKLRQQAAIDVQLGKENEARELLFQKRKVMQALEKSKSRIELLDQLSAKLNEAISLKETQLIGNCALDLEIGKKDDLGPIRIISPKEDDEKCSDDNEDNYKPVTMNLNEDQELQFQEFQENLPVNHQQEDDEERNLSIGIWKKEDMISSLQGISSYEDFLEHLDQQFNKIELELATVLRLSTLVLENGEKPRNSKCQQIMDILETVCGIRGRIASIMQMKAEIR
ncbi:PREDICTED: uncharacterized protein LOC104610638 [Nelumbo nucifera]|uniref:Uncharacterized protein LOC104610638 n=1 Tax=Nelumbo nucifera TaxID=4432 RepID=A0A1U8B469_NELNU|nr:PREDICTED: uncharacterized protein LOC104610638 [Nelumbo nucifera]XP_019055517.1 PREDICTED: uncharacterized protein LOC104610638 [Nelumbo nucifera]XP_019055519.1 PREDICTED: uncharacterized protein LOC104610638 [Nelumbo nucifera]